MLDFFKKYWKNILLILFSIIIIMLLMSTTCASRKLSISENNVIALKDSIRTYELKNGELLSAKQSLILEKDELNNFLEITQKERKDIEKKLNSSLSYIAKLESNVKIDTLVMTDSVYVKDGVTNINFKYNDTWIQIDGITKFKDTLNSITSLNNLNVNVPLKVGLTEDNQFFVTSSNPYINITKIDGAKIENKSSKPKRWNVGVQAGVGLQYGLLNKTLDIGPYVGVGISYGLGF